QPEAFSLPPPAARAPKGLRHKLGRSQPEMAAPAIDLGAYRKRADELRKRLESAADPLRELGVLRLKLEELLDDLRSTGAADAELRPVTDLLAELQAFLLAPADVAAMVKRCTEVLGAFANGAQPKRQGWWK